MKFQKAHRDKYAPPPGLGLRSRKKRTRGGPSPTELDHQHYKQRADNYYGRKRGRQT